MAVYRSKTPTQDGRVWFFKTQYSTNDSENEILTKISKKFETKAEAMKAEHDFLIFIYEHKNTPIDMTLGELYKIFLKKKQIEVKESTYFGYLKLEKYIKCFLKIKCTDYNIQQYMQWKTKMNKTKLKNRTKNDVLKYWKSILNFGTNNYNFNFSRVYNKMSNFTDPNEPKREMQFYTLDEFDKFITNETSLMYKCLWETLFFCGLRCGEARGLTWDNINFENKILSVKKQLYNNKLDDKGNYIFISPKTRTSYRSIPICNLLYDDLLKYKNKLLETNDFKLSNFVFGHDGGKTPLSIYGVTTRKKELAESVDLKVIRLHDFRHSCASLLINNGANVTIVAKYLGHSQIEETLNTYSHMFPNALDNVINIINKLD